MYRRIQNPRIAKLHRSYEVDEVVKLYECHRNTVYNWMKEGLKPIDGRYPLLFHGSSLNAFHAKRRERNRRRCGPGEVYCVTCRAATAPAGATVDYRTQTHSTGIIVGICPRCERLIYRIVGARQLEEFRERCSVNVLPKRNA